MTALKLLALAAACLVPAVGPAQKPQPPALTAAEEKAVANCLAIIRECQLPDGAIRMKATSNAPTNPVWVQVYAGAFAANALLCAHERKPNAADLARVGRWLEWCAKNQAADGHWNDHEGTVAAYRDNGKCDSWDSYCAMVLLTTDRFHKLGGKVSPAVRAAAKKALAAIESVADQDGLTWAKPDYRVKFGMDNIETYGGLRAAVRFFDAVGDSAEAKRAADLADKIARKLPDYWQADAKAFAYALHPNGVFEGGLQNLYPHGLANLFAITWVSPKNAAPWKTMLATMTPDGGDAPQAAPEWWLIAAHRVGTPAEVKTWRAKVTTEAAGFTKGNIYVGRAGIAALSLLRGADWLPSVAESNK